MHYKSTSNTAETKKKILSIRCLRYLSKIGHHHKKSFWGKLSECQDHPRKYLKKVTLCNWFQVMKEQPLWMGICHPFTAEHWVEQLLMVADCGSPTFGLVLPTGGRQDKCVRESQQHAITTPTPVIPSATHLLSWFCLVGLVQVGDQQLAVLWAVRFQQASAKQLEKILNSVSVGAYCKKNMRICSPLNSMSLCSNFYFHVTNYNWQKNVPKVNRPFFPFYVIFK